MLIKRLLQPFAAEGTDEQLQLKRVLNIIIWAILITGLLGTLIGIVARWELALPIAIVTSIEAIIALLLHRKGKTIAAAALALCSILIATNVSAWAGEGIHDVIIIALPGAIIIASLLGNLTIYIVFAALIVLSPAAIIAAKHLTGIPYTAIDGEPSNLILLTVLLAATAVAMRLLANDLISSLRRAKESESRYRGIFASIRDCYFEMDLKGAFLEISPSGESLLGESRDRVLGRSVKRFIVSKDGDAEISAFLRTPETLENSEMQIRGGGGAVHTVLISAFIELDGSGAKKISGSFRDITGHRELEKQLSMVQRMESVGTLAGGVAHDFNNLLTVINGNAEMSLEKLSSGSADLNDELTGILEAGRRAAMLTAQLLTFSRRQVIEPVSLDLNASIKNLNQVIRPLIGEDIQVRYELAEKLPSILADPSQMEQILINLLVNARDATASAQIADRSKKINITTSVKYCAYSSFHDSNMPTSQDTQEAGGQEFVVLSITDHGIGMPPDVQSRIFEPFYTTKDTGTGLGLATVYGIVRQNEAHITLESQQGHGTTARVYWPCNGLHTKFEVPRETTAIGGNETVLLVEDEDGVRKMTAKALKANGYSVREATNGRKALDLLASAKVDLVITDMVMPEMGGKELISAISKMYPSISILLLSGYSTDQFDDDTDSDHAPRMLQKPYTIKGLLFAVRNTLDEDLS